METLEKIDTTRQLTQELSLKQISKIILQNWPLYLVLFSALSILSFGLYKYKVPYVASSSLIVNDVQNSSLQSFAQSHSGHIQNKTTDSKKTNSTLNKYIEFLNTTEFYNLFIQNAQKAQFKQLTLLEKEGQKIFLKEIKENSINTEDRFPLYKKIESFLKIKLKNDYELEVSAQTMSKEYSLFLSNVALVTIQETLKNKEFQEITKIRTFLESQKNVIDLEIESLNKQMMSFNEKPENLISLSSKEKVGEYISELMVRKNEYQMKISENNKMIQMLSQGNPQRRESQLYGVGGQIQALKNENEILYSKLSQAQISIDRVSQQAKSIPLATMTFEDLKKKSEIEFAKYKEVSDQLSKAQAFELSLNNKFEILEFVRADKIAPQVSILTLILASLVIAQILGSLIIYITSIWDSNIVTAESTRNVVVIDSHSLDPRVIIENSKIKFRLRHAEFEEGESSPRLGFSFYSRAHGQNGESPE